MKNIQNLTIDINKKPFQTITANVGEVASRFIRITILENNIPADLTGVTAYLYAKKVDGTKVFNSVTVEDAKQGIVLAELTSQVLAIPGLVKLTLLLTKDGAKLASKQIIVTVDESAIDEDAIQSSNEFNALTDALKKVNNIDSKASKAELEAERRRIDNFTSLKEGSTTGDAELIDGRVGIDGTVYSNIGNSIREQLNEIVEFPVNLWSFGDFSYSYSSTMTWRYVDYDITDIIQKGVQYSFKADNILDWVNTNLGSIIGFASDNDTRIYRMLLDPLDGLEQLFTVPTDERIVKIVIRFQVLVGETPGVDGKAQINGIKLNEVGLGGKKLRDDIYISGVEKIDNKLNKINANIYKLTDINENLWTYGDVSRYYAQNNTYIYSDYDITSVINEGETYCIKIGDVKNHVNTGYIIKVYALLNSDDKEHTLALMGDSKSTSFTIPSNIKRVYVRFMTVSNSPSLTSSTAYYSDILLINQKSMSINSKVNLPQLNNLISSYGNENLWTYGDISQNYNSDTTYLFEDFYITDVVTPGKNYKFKINEIHNHVRENIVGFIYVNDKNGNALIRKEINLNNVNEWILFTIPLIGSKESFIRIQPIYDVPAGEPNVATYIGIELIEDVGPVLKDDVLIPKIENKLDKVHDLIDSCFEYRVNKWTYGNYFVRYITGQAWLYKDFRIEEELEKNESYVLNVGTIENNPRKHEDYQGTDADYLGVVIQYDNTGSEVVRNQFYTNTLPIKFVVADNTSSVVVRFQTLSATGAIKDGTMGYIDITLYKESVLDGVTLLKDTVKVEAVEKIKTEIDDLTELVKNESVKPKWITGEAEVFNNATISLENNHIGINKKMFFSANVGDNFNSLLMGHGKTSYGSAYLEITNTNVIVYRYTTGVSTVKKYEHGLDIDKYINVSIETDINQQATIRIITPSGKSEQTGISWGGNNGAIFVESVNSDLTNAKVKWTCTDYDKKIHICGDSYCGITNNARIPYYLKEWGYHNFLLDSYAGRGSSSAYNSLVLNLKHSSPKYVVWLMGQNDPDSLTSINSTWMTYTNKLIELCEENNVEPIFCTIPNVLGGAVDDSDISNSRNHSFKNDWIKKSGYRYIDWCEAVGADESISWYDGMLSTDKVHPTTLGALVLATKLVQDFPEITFI